MANYSIRLLDVGRFPEIPKPLLTYMYGFGETIRVPIVMWAVGGRGERILIDTGCGGPQRSLAYHRLLEQTKGQRPKVALKKVGWNPEDVDLVILTHLHWDHCGNNSLFKRAFIFVMNKGTPYLRFPDLSIEE